MNMQHRVVTFGADSASLTVTTSGAATCWSAGLDTPEKRAEFVHRVAQFASLLHLATEFEAEVAGDFEGTLAEPAPALTAPVVALEHRRELRRAEASRHEHTSP